MAKESQKIKKTRIQKYESSYDLKEINKIRKESGLSEIKIKIRNCLKCEKSFYTDSFFLCYECRTFCNNNNFETEFKCKL